MTRLHTELERVEDYGGEKVHGSSTSPDYHNDALRRCPLQVLGLELGFLRTVSPLLLARLWCLSAGGEPVIPRAEPLASATLRIQTLQ